MADTNGIPSEKPAETPAASTPLPELKPEEIVTPEIIKEIEKNYGRPELEFVDFEVAPATAAGDNYGALLFSAIFHYKNRKTGKHEDFPVMLKVLPRNEARVKMLNDANIFLKEVYMYKMVLPDIEQFQRDKAGLSEEEIFAPWPKCFGAKVDGKTDFVALENLRTQGFRMGNRKDGLDFEHCKLILEHLARFHAITFAMLDGDFDKILEKYPWLEETMFTTKKEIPDFMKDVYKGMFAQQVAMLREKGAEKEASIVDKVYDDNFIKKLAKLLGEKVKNAVICHGDCWTNNFLFRYDENEKPVELKFIDFQLSRPCSRAIDIHYFIHSSPQMQVLNEREVELESIYFEEFTRHAKKLGVDLDAHELTKDNFQDELDTFRFYGAVMGLMLAMITSADSKDVPEMEIMSEEEMTNPDAVANFFGAMVKDRAIVKLRNIASLHLPRCAEIKDLI